MERAVVFILGRGAVVWRERERASGSERRARSASSCPLSLSRPPPPWAHNDKRMHISPRETRLDLKTLLKSIDNNESYAPRSLC